MTTVPRATLTPDPLADGGLSCFAVRFRNGEITSEQATLAYLARIDALDGRLGAFQHVAAEQAVAAARTIDALFVAGTDLGPLMGVPISVKDLFVVDGMPTTAGSLMRVDDITGAEGPFVRRLKAAGCVILGKTKAVEFGLGITGVSTPRGTPWNPWDAEVQRLPGGSSSGAGVAVAAGLCGFAIGGDTGGSVRVPAALCGVFGLKTTFGLWSCEGAFPLAAHIDTVGLLTKSARDAAVVFAHITGEAEIEPAPLDRLHIGKLDGYFLEDLESAVEHCLAGTIEVLHSAGVKLGRVELPEATEREQYFPVVFPACLIGTLGRDRFRDGRHLMDHVIEKRVANGLDIQASDYLALEARRRRSMASAMAKFEGWDAWISTTIAVLPPPVVESAGIERGTALALAMSRNTQPANYLDFCAASIPVPRSAGELPVGLQIMCPPSTDSALLAIAIAVEELLGAPSRPLTDMFL